MVHSQVLWIVAKGIIDTYTCKLGREYLLGQAGTQLSSNEVVHGGNIK